MLRTGVDLPPLARSVHELPMTDDGLPTVGSVTDAVVNEPEALAGFDVEGTRVVSHVDEVTDGLSQPPREASPRMRLGLAS